MTAESSGVAGSPSAPRSALLTFLLADIRGYTAYTAEHGDHAAAHLSELFLSVCREVAAAHEGEVFGSAGDQALAAFPSARQALRAAVALQDRLAVEGAHHPGLPLSAGVGLDAGEAIQVGSDYRGGALNLAARLCSLAAAGEVLASDAVTHLARKIEGLSYAERGQVQLKGFADPVMVMEVMSEHGSKAEKPVAIAGESEDRFPAQELPIGGFLGTLPTNPLIGRDQVLAQVLEAVDAVGGGAGRLIMLAGEPGAGKTRLAQEVTLHLRNREFLVAAGRCYQPEQVVPYYPFLDALAMVYAAAPSSLRRDAARRWPYLGVLLPDQIGAPDVAAGSGQDEQQRVFRAVTGFLEAVSATRPLGILLDDLHWVDSTSLKLLLYLAQHTRTMPILLLGTYRDVEVGRGHALEGALRDLHRDGLLERVDVRRLDEDGTAALVASTMGEEGISQEFAGLVHGRTEGNPYFVHQVLRELVERGDVFRQNGVWDRRAVEEIEVPESVRSVVGQRLARLADTTQEVLREASVVGQTFAFDELLAVSQRSEREVEDALEEASGVGLIRDRGHDVYGFDHALTQQSIYAELSSRRTRRLHLALGGALEQLPERARAGRVAEIARHFLEAGDPARAVQYAILAGDRAEAVFAHTEAERQYRTAARLAGELGKDAAEAEALEKLGKTLELQSLPDQELEALQAAARIYHTMGDLMGEARVTVGVGSALMHLGNPEEAIARLRAVLPALEEQEPSPVLAQVCLQLAAILYGSGQFEAGLELTNRTREVARTIGDAAIFASAENYRGDVLMQMGKFEDARQVFEAIIPEAEASGDVGILAHSVNDLAVTYIYTGRFALGVSNALRAVELQQRRESPSMVAFALNILGMAYLYAGQWAEARRALEQAEQLIQHLPPSWHAAFVLGYLGMVDTVEGRWEEAHEHLLQAIALGAESRVVLPLAHQWLAEREILEGDPAAARTRLEPLAGDRSMWTMMMLPTLGWAQVESGEIAAADALVTRLVTDTDVQMPIMVTEALRVQGMVRHRQGRDEEARNAFDGAISLARHLEYPHAEGRALYEWGRLRAESGAGQGAEEQLTSALRIFQHLGAQPDIVRAERTLADHGPN